jgi:hypothetical protein
MDDNLYNNPELDERLLPPQELQDELLQTNEVHTLSDIVDAHADDQYNVDATTRGLDPADLAEPDPLADVIGYAGNFSNDGMAGERVDDALMTDYDEPEAVMAGEYGPDDADIGSDMIDNLRNADEQAPSLNEQEVLSGGVGHVRPGAATPTGFQIEEIGEPGTEPTLANETGEPDFARVEETTDRVTAASRRGLAYAEDDDDLHTRDVTEGT